MLRRRYKRWKPDGDLIISESKYNMVNVHKFINKCFNREYVDMIVLKNGMFKKYQLYGTVVHSEDKLCIFLDAEQPIEQRFISALHEIFHVFFHDYENWDDKYYDIVENRAEVSAMNMLSWYYSHGRYFSTFKKNVFNLKIEELSTEDKELIQE